MKPILYRQAVRRVADHAPAVIYRAIAKDHIRMANALKKIAKLGTTQGYDTKDLDMAAIAQRALGDDK